MKKEAPLSIEEVLFEKMRISKFLSFKKLLDGSEMKKEKGVATILAIGLVTLLLCIVTAYLTTSIIEKKAAINYQFMIMARLASQTAFNRAMARIQEAGSNQTKNPEEIVSHRKGMQTWMKADTETLATKLTTVINGEGYYYLPNNYPSGFKASDPEAITWQYFKVDHADSEPITRRIAYVAIPDRGRINPWAVVDSGVNAAQTGKSPPSESNYGGTNQYTSVDPSGNYVIGRPGRDLSEISLASMEADTVSFTDSYSQKMSAKTSHPAGLVEIGEGGNWREYEQLFSALNIDANETIKRDYFRTVFCVNETEDPEAFWIDTGGDFKITPNKIYHRFNLARSDWDTLTVDSILNADGTTIGEKGKSSPQSSSTSFESNYLPWLKNWRDKGDCATPDIARKQIIANLITYCKSDTNAVTDYPSSNPPTYVGLERCPYIDEVEIQLKGSIKRIKNRSSKFYNFIFSIAPIIHVKLVDIYGISNTPSIVYIDSIRVRYNWGTSNYQYSADTQIQRPLSFPVNITPSKSYCSIDGTSPLIALLDNKSQTDLDVSSVGSLRIKVLLTDIHVRLMGKDTISFYDYSILPDTTSFTEFFPSNSGMSSKTKRIKFLYQVADPRQNLNASDWKASVKVSASNEKRTLKNEKTTLKIVAPQSTVQAVIVNSTFTPVGPNKDPEPYATAPWKLSTAYIRKAPMKSPWELGFIHRAKAFQTLNLRKYNNLRSNQYGFGPNSGGEDYSYGDANILDQIKMTQDSRTLGKVNINSDNTSVLRALFDHIAVGSNPSEPGSFSEHTKILSRANATALALNLKSINGSDKSGSRLLTRAEIVNMVPSLSDGSIVPQATKREKEEIIGKFINLTKAEPPGEYTIIAIGEAIKERREISNSKNKNRTISLKTNAKTEEPNAYEVLSSQKILATVKKDFTKNNFYIERMFYLNE